MKFVTISDVHIKEPGDLAEKLFLRFLNSNEVSKCDCVFLLGDIFDLFVGPHLEHINKFQAVFDKLISLSKEGKKIHYFEGNHDFHFDKLIETYSKENQVSRNWIYHTAPIVYEVCGKSIFFAHGDEIELNNKSYQRYRTFIRSRFIKLVAESLLKYSLIEVIGAYFSKKSRERNVKNYGSHNENEQVKARFRENIVKAYNDYSKPDLIFCGHSHCHEEWETESFSYYNNGFFPALKSFFYFDGEKAYSIDLQAD